MFHWPYYWLYCCYKHPDHQPACPQPSPAPSPSLPEITEAIERYLNSPEGRQLLTKIAEEYINNPEQQSRIRSWLRTNLPELLRSPAVRNVLREIVKDILSEGEPLG